MVCPSKELLSLTVVGGFGSLEVLSLSPMLRLTPETPVTFLIVACQEVGSEVGSEAAPADDEDGAGDEARSGVSHSDLTRSKFSFSNLLLSCVNLWFRSTHFLSN